MTQDNKKPKKSIDPYTGEETREAEDANKITEISPVDGGNREGANFLLEEESSMDHIAADADADAVAEKSEQFTNDPAVEEELDEYHSMSPKLSGGDIDAKWEYANSGGEETVGGTVPTPDQDVVEELGEAVGITYEDDEPLHTEEKLQQRDEERYELNPNTENRKNRKDNKKG
jgi:hypothetical protein